MALPVIVVVLASAVSGAFLYDQYQKAKTKQLEQGQASQQAFNQAATQLDKGKPYIVQLMVDPKQPGWLQGQPTNFDAQQLIKSTFQQLGWVFPMGSTPKVRDEINASRFFAGQPSEWVFTATWNRDDKFQRMTPAWAAMAIPYLIPVLPGYGN